VRIDDIAGNGVSAPILVTVWAGNDTKLAAGYRRVLFAAAHGARGT
jgi:hypothetical protein